MTEPNQEEVKESSKVDERRSTLQGKARRPYNNFRPNAE